MSSAWELLIAQKIDATDYQIMKNEYGDVLKRLQERMKIFTESNESLAGLLNKGFYKLKRLKKACSNGALLDARELIGLIYPENFTFGKINSKPLGSTKLLGVFIW